MAGPITMKLSGIDRGNSVTVLGRVRGGMNQDSCDGQAGSCAAGGRAIGGWAVMVGT